MKKLSKRNVLNTAALGLSLLMSSTLLVGNAVSVYAAPTISTTEQNAIDAFLATQPVDGDTRNIGTTNPTVTPSTYTFPSMNNYVSVFRMRNRDMTLQHDNVYQFPRIPGDQNSYINVKIKDFNSVVWHKIYSTPGYIAFHGSESDAYYARKITVINQADNTEIVVDYPILHLNSSTINVHYIATGRGSDIPIEAEDPRFHIEYELPEYEEQATMYAYGGHRYWNFSAPIDEKYSYDTIVQIDESLKSNEVVATGGRFGEKSATFIGYHNVIEPADTLQAYTQYNADVIYNMMKTDLHNATNDGYFITNSFVWGEYSGTVHITPSVNRVIRVGIDYTHYVADDGTVLKPTTYGLNPVDTIAGYQFVSSHREANGDLVHVYTVPTAPVTPAVPTTPSTPSSPSTPISPSTPSTPASVSSSPRTMDKASIFGFSVMFLVGIFTSVGVFFTRNKRA